ncbi:AfsR/SARP family transcriptional regulator [Plantactinospora soyae]|uniref:DNA-binding SARP family transcriptional activator n=1 Tax=Plantactinospora soyae TaxID=1544732 RepID=A0A927M806_9ACTN|nr:AfsR/SARP family transcriptional regulator [Plantactinospora soyae]MBE1488600.1 DNA-binding SARP family transcriptional activator [Plantactinospora soyae]
MRYRILGPLAIEAAGVPLRIRSARVSALLATLLLEANRTVPTDRLIEAVWEWHAPPTARSQLTIVVSQLRRLLARAGAPPTTVLTETAGYRLTASTHEIDALLFEQWVGDAERAMADGALADAAEGLRAALDLWRGPALTGMDGQVIQTAATLLAERRAAVQSRRIELDFALGRHDCLVTELVGLVSADPFNERLRTDLIIALYRSGRVTHALDAFGEFRRRLADEFGIEPSPQLVALHRQILNRDPVLDPPLGPASPTSPGPTGRNEPDRPGRRPGGPPGHRRTGGLPGRRPDGMPRRRPAGQPRGPAHRRPGGRNGTAVLPCPGWVGLAEPGAPGTGAPEHWVSEESTRTVTPGPERISSLAAEARPTSAVAPAAGRAAVVPSGIDTAPVHLPATPADPRDVPVTPRQLPPAVADFVGREAELARIRRVVDARTGRPGPAVVVVAGLAGVGKTALAVRSGWQLGADHPDGCLYAELTDRQDVPVDPHEVLGAFLRALGVPDRSIPANRTERCALYRSVVAERRLLVVLDGAADEDQVRPLLPTGPASAALITARRPLTGLDGAQLVALDVLPVDSAVRLLTGMLPERVADDVPAAHRVAQLCDGLPLAIRVTGSRLAARAERSLAQSAERLADGTRRLDRLAEGGRDVRRGLATTYQRLAPATATLFRRLGSLPVAEFPGWLVVPLLDADRSTAELALTELVDAGLVHPGPAGSAGAVRYRMPELIRLYAQERVALDDPPPLRATAFRRAYWWLLELTLRADERVPGQGFPTGDLGPPEGFGPPAEVLRAVDDDPVGWLTAERRLVAAAVAHTATLGDTELAWRLAVAPTNFLQLRGYLDDWQRALDQAGTALRGRSAPARAEAVLALSSALLLLSRGEVTEAWTAARTGRRLFRELGDPQRVASCATVQWMATRRMHPLDPEGPVNPVGITQNAARRTGDDVGVPPTSSGAARRAGIARRATPAPRPAEHPAQFTSHGSVHRTPEVVAVVAGQVGPPDPVRPGGE